MLSFDQFRLDLSERITFVVGPNGAGKSNLTRLLTICLRAVESGDGAAGDVDRLLASFLAARHVGSQSPGIEARVAVRLTDMLERDLVTEFVGAMVTGAMTARRQVQNMAEIDAWAEAEITEAKLLPLMEGEIVTSHPGTPDGRWQSAYEFTAPGHDQSERRYQWILLGLQSGAIFDADAPVTTQGSDIATRITGSSNPPSGPAIPVPGGFQLLDLLPKPDLSTMSCTFDLSGTPSGSQRRFAGMTGLPLISPGGGRMVNLATVLRVIFRRALVQTSDTRLLPAGGVSWSSSDLTLGKGAEARLPELLLRLKNGDPSERVRYQRITDLFTEFTQGRSCEVRLIQVQQPTQDGQGSTTVQVPAIWVTVNANAGSEGLAPEIPIEFAGAGAWEALSSSFTTSLVNVGRHRSSPVAARPRDGPGRLRPARGGGLAHQRHHPVDLALRPRGLGQHPRPALVPLARKIQHRDVVGLSEGPSKPGFLRANVSNGAQARGRVG